MEDFVEFWTPTTYETRGSQDQPERDLVTNNHGINVVGDTVVGILYSDITSIRDSVEELMDLGVEQDALTTHMRCFHNMAILFNELTGLEVRD